MKCLFQSNFLTHILNSVQTFTSLTIYNTVTVAPFPFPQMTFPRKILLFSPTVSQYVQSGNRFQRYYYIATERVEANRCPVCDEIKPCTKADASGRRQWWQLWREGDGRKEGCPSLCGNLQLQGYRAVPFAFSPSLPFS